MHREARPSRARHLLDASMFWGPSGGVRRVLTVKHLLMRARGWCHTVMAPGLHGPGLADCGGLPLPGSGGYRLPLGRARLSRLIEAQAPDLVESADPYPLAWATLDATARLRIPAVAFCHSHLPLLAARWIGGPEGVRTRRGAWAARHARDYLVDLYNRFDLVMAPSQGLVHQLRDWGVAHAELQPLGVDCAAFRPSRADPVWREQFLRGLGLPARARLLVYTGRFAPEKHLEVLAEAVRRLGPGHLFVAVGSGPLPPRGEGVLVLPVESDSRRLARLLASADVYVHAGDQETFGLGVLEAMACGTPVVASAAAGTGELVRGAGTGVVGLDPARWAAAIEASLQHRHAAQRALALERARAHDWPVVLDRLCLRYLELLESHRRALRPPEGSGLSLTGRRVDAHASALR